MQKITKISIFDRNKTIFDLALSGKSYRQIGKRFRLSRARIGQIIRRCSSARESPCMECGKMVSLDKDYCFCFSKKGMKGKPIAGHKKKNLGVYGKGWKAQRLFEMECERRNIPFIPKYRTENFDYLVNGLRIEIKFVTMENGKGLAAFKKNDFDLMICYLKQSVPTWIFIPRSMTSSYPGGGFYITNEKIPQLKDHWEWLERSKEPVL